MHLARKGYSPQRGKAKPGALSRRAMGRAKAPQHRTVYFGALVIVVDASVLPDWRDVAEHMDEPNASRWTMFDITGRLTGHDSAIT